MITPAFGLTATERVLPKLALDFTTASLDSRITFARALNTATRVNSSGYIENVNADVARFDYNPVSKICKGLLIEEARTNLILYSEDMSNAAWVYNAPLAVSSTDAVVAPTGLQTADVLSTTNQGSFYQDVTITGTNTHTISFFVHTSSTCTNFTISAFYLASTFANFNIVVNPTTGAIISSTATTYGSENYGNGWYRFWATKAGTSAADTFLRLQCYNNISSPNTLVVWGAQVEVGAFPTSYIPTTTTSLTRNADVATMTGTNFSSWYNSTASSYVAEFTTPAGFTSGVAYNLVTFWNGSVITNQINTRYGLLLGGSPGSIDTWVKSGGVDVVDSGGADIAANTTYKHAVAVELNSAANSTNAGTIYPGAPASMPSGITVLTFASGSAVAAEQPNHTLRKFFYFPQRLTNAELQAFTK